MSTNPTADMTGCIVKRTSDGERFRTEWDQHAHGLRLEQVEGDTSVLLELGAFRNQLKGGEYYFPDQTEHREFMDGYEAFRTNNEHGGH